MSTIDYKNKTKCAVFDLDGTLLNTIKTINYYLNLALGKNGLGSISEEKCMSFVGDGAVKLVQRALTSLDVNDDEAFSRVFADYNAAYDADPYYLTEIYDGITDMLSDLRNKGISVCVLSNKPDFATKSAVSYFFGDLLSAVSGARDGVRLKPYPDSLLSMISTLGFTPAETVYIGDSQQDILTAKNAGVGGCISVTWGFRSREELISSGAEQLAYQPSDISKIIKTASF